MTVVAGPAPSWVNLTLDTTPPVLVVAADAAVEAPGHWVVTVRSNEDLGPSSARFEDGSGKVYSVGIERTGPRLLRMEIPTLKLIDGTLVITARDTACNLTTLRRGVQVLREAPFDVVLTIEHGLEVEMSMDRAFEIEVGIEHGHEASLTLDGAFEGRTDIAHSHDTTLEITDGD